MASARSSGEKAMQKTFGERILRSLFLVFMSQILMVSVSWEPVASRFPSDDIARELIGVSEVSDVSIDACRDQSDVLQISTMPERLPKSRRELSGENATELIDE